MEIKFIIYIVGGILYFLYKKTQDDKKAVPPPQPKTEEQQAAPEPKPVRPPANNPLEELRREAKRRQDALEAQKKLSTPAAPQPILSSQKTNIPKDIFLHEKKKATFGEGANDAPVYERGVNAPEKIVRGDVRLKNEGIYRVETMEEARALADDAAFEEYEFDAKQAFIGSVIFERKF